MEGGWFDDEAIEAERFDADMEQAEFERVGNNLARARRAGRCVHGSWVGLPAGGAIYPEQEGLTGTQVRCTDGCGQVFADDDAILAAFNEVAS